MGESTSRTKIQVSSYLNAHIILCSNCHCLCRYKVTVKSSRDWVHCSECIVNWLTLEIDFQYSGENGTLLKTLWFCTQDTCTDSRNLLELINRFIRVAGCKINPQNQYLFHVSIRSMLRNKSRKQCHSHGFKHT